jgi:hypothetical protein
VEIPVETSNIGHPLNCSNSILCLIMICEYFEPMDVEVAACRPHKFRVIFRIQYIPTM